MRFRCRFGIHRYDNSVMLPVRHVRVAWLECDCGKRGTWSHTYLQEDPR